MVEQTAPEKSSNLIALFNQWQLLEPERCRESEGVVDVYLESSWISALSFRISSDPSAVGWAVIQAAVQDAIRNRQWRFRITDASNHFGNKIACYEIDIMDHDFEYLVEREYTDPSYGLLDAYVTALERNAQIMEDDRA